MIAFALLSHAAGVPAAVAVAVGVIGALDAHYRQRTPRRSVATGVPALERLPVHVPERTPDATRLAAVSRDNDAPDIDTNLDGKDAALHLLDAWSACPRSSWHALGKRCARSTRSDANAHAAATVILEGVLAHHASPLDVWIVREAADTAWYLAPHDGVSLSAGAERAARAAVSHAALALLVSHWLPAQDSDRLVNRVA